MISLLIEKGVESNAQNDSGKTALMLAAFYGKLNAIKELRDHGADYSVVDNAGLSTLHYAVDGGNLDTIQWLIMDGHPVDTIDNSGWTPLLRNGIEKNLLSKWILILKEKKNLNFLIKQA